MFRFTIRDVLWLTVVVGLALGWGLDRWGSRSERLRLKKRLDDLQGRDGAWQRYTKVADPWMLQ